MPEDDLAPLAIRFPLVSKDPGKRVLEHGHGILWKLTPCFLMLDRAFALSHSKNGITACLPFLGLLFPVWLRLEDVGVPTSPQPTALAWRRQ